MDTLILLLIAGCIVLAAIRYLSKNEKLRETAGKILYAIAALLLIYVSLTQYLNSGSEPEIIGTDPEPSITITDPEPSVTVPDPGNDPAPGNESAAIDENGSYDSKEEVALYIHTYGRLPGNYITKNEAEKLGWTGGSVDKYAPGKCIGGSRFYNNEKKLPNKSGRKYYECDIDTIGASSRGAKRLIYSNDGYIYYTDDHYETFELLYNGEE
ncbi:MAG: ribonuclease [Oscillospiraceae bacterium]|nr:ribonuclease [Oscillospiraceae bacterium]